MMRWATSLRSNGVPRSLGETDALPLALAFQGLNRSFTGAMKASFLTFFYPSGSPPHPAPPHVAQSESGHQSHPCDWTDLVPSGLLV
jgi:hypothetical protein